MNKKEAIDGYIKHLEEKLEIVDKLITTAEQLMYNTKLIAIKQFLIFRLDLWFDYFKLKREINLRYKEKIKVELEIDFLKEQYQ